MSTRRFALDRRGKRFYIGSVVEYNNKTFLVEDMQFHTWSREQYITLCDKRNKNKKIEFVASRDVLAKHKTN